MRDKISRFIAYAVVLFCVAIIMGIIVISCMPATTYTHKNIPAPQTRYSFTGFKIPETKSPASVSFTVAVVEPFYKEKVAQDYSNVIKSFSSSVGIGLDEILVAKGLTTKGPYESLDEMPYPDKKGANLTLTQTVFINVIDKGLVSKGTDNYDDGKGGVISAEVETRRLSAEIWIAFEMREPLSVEKMWIKKLDLGVFEEDYQVATELRYYTYKSADPWAPPRGEWKYGNIVFNTKTDVFAGILNKAYPKVMQAAWTYLNTEEMLNLEKKVEEIRKLKVY